MSISFFPLGTTQPFIKDILKRYNNMFDMSTYLNDKMNNLELVDMHFSLELYFQWLIPEKNTFQPQNEFKCNKLLL